MRGQDFRSLGNALYPELNRIAHHEVVDFRSLGNALYPELSHSSIALALDFRSLGNALYPEPNSCRDVSGV